MLHTLVGVVVVLHTDSPACNLVGETVGIFRFIVQKNIHKYTVISNEPVAQPKLSDLMLQGLICFNICFFLLLVMYV